MTDNIIDKHTICANCGHYYHLHLNFKGECDACDSPEYKMEDRCPGFEAVVVKEG